MEKSYRQIWILFAGALVLVLAGFFKTYFVQFPRFEKTSVVIHLHVLFFLMWFVLLFIQPWLIRKGNYPLHKKVGRISYLLVPLITLSTLLVVRDGYFRNLEKFPITICIGNLIFPITQLIVFDSLFLLAIWNVRTTPVHMRHMIGCSVILTGPAIRRIFVFWMGMPSQQAATLTFLTVLLIFGALFYYDQTHGKIYYSYIVAAILYMLFFISYNYFGQSWLWQQACGWFVKWFF